MPTIVLICLCLCLVLEIGAEAPRRLVVAFPDFAPLNYLNDQGDISGSTVDIVRAALARSGYQFEGKVFPVRRALMSMKRGEFDILSCMGNASYQDLGDSVRYSDVVVGYLHLGAYHLKTSPNISDKEGLLGQGVVIRRGYRYAGMVDWLLNEKNNFSLQKVNSAEQGLRLIISRRKPYFLEYQSAIDIAAKSVDLSMVRRSTLSKLPHFLVFSKTSVSQEMQNKIEQAIRVIVAHNK